MKKPARKIVTIEVETTASNKDLKYFYQFMLTKLLSSKKIKVIQVQVNVMKKEKTMD